MEFSREPPPHDGPIESAMWLNKEWYIDFEHLVKLLAVEDTDSQTQSTESTPSKQIHPYKTRQYKPNLPSKSASRKLIHYSPTSQSSIQANSFTDLVNLRDETLSEMFSSDSATPWWLDFQNPSQTELQLLCLAFGVHPVTIEDISYREDQEKLEESSNYFFACLRSYREVKVKGETEYEPYPIYFLVFKKGILTFSFGDGKHGERVQKRIELLKDYVAINSHWIFYAFVDDIVDSFFPLVAKIEKRSTEVEDQVYNKRPENMQAFLCEIEAARKSAFSLMKLLDGKKGILSSFEQHHCASNIPQQGHNLQHYINDVQDHVNSLRSSLNLSESLLSRSQFNYVTGIEVETNLSRQRINRVLSRTAVVSMVLTFLTMIAGFFSVNLVGAQVAPWHPFVYTVSGMTVLGVLLVLLARKYGYF